MSLSAPGTRATRPVAADLSRRATPRVGADGADRCSAAPVRIVGPGSPASSTAMRGGSSRHVAPACTPSSRMPRRVAKVTPRTFRDAVRPVRIRRRGPRPSSRAGGSWWMSCPLDKQGPYPAYDPRSAAVLRACTRRARPLASSRRPAPIAQRSANDARNNEGIG